MWPFAPPPAGVTYVDSYGLPCFQPDVLAFLAACRRPVRFNLRQIQAAESKACGFFALLYILYIGQRLNFKIRFARSSSRLASNDGKCFGYLRKILNDREKRLR